MLDWSKQDMVSIALGPAVYVFDASLGDVHQLCDLDSFYVTSLQWNRSGKYLAVGTSDAEVQVRGVDIRRRGCWIECRLVYLKVCLQRTFC